MSRSFLNRAVTQSPRLKVSGSESFFFANGRSWSRQNSRVSVRLVVGSPDVHAVPNAFFKSARDELKDRFRIKPIEPLIVGQSPRPGKADFFAIMNPVISCHP